MQIAENTARIPDQVSIDQFSSPSRRADIFTLSDVLNDFSADFLNSEICRQWVLKRLHPAGAFCPECGVLIQEKQAERFWSGFRLRCSCGKFYTSLTGTFLSGCQLDFREIILIAVLLSLGVSDRHIASVLNMSAANVRLWRLKFEAIEKLRSGKVFSS